MANYKVGSFAAPGPLGNQVISGVGFQPKALIVYACMSTAAGFRDHAFPAVGFATSPTERGSVSTWSEAGLATSNSARSMAERLIATTYGDATALEAELVSFDADGFTVNWVKNGLGGSYIFNYIAIGGADVSAKVVTWTAPTPSPADKSVTGVGFQPDMVFHAGTLTTALTQSAVENNLTFGVADKYGNQWSNSFRSGDAVSPSNTSRYQRTDKCIATVDVNESVLVQGAFKSMDADGFSMTFDTVSGAVRYYVTLCLKGAGFKAGAFQKTAGAVPASQTVTGVPFTPECLLLSSVRNPPGAAASADISWGLGAASSAADEKGIAVRDKDNAASTSAHSHQADNILTIVDDGGATVTAQAELTSFGVNQFTLNWTTNNVGGTQYEVCYVAFGEAPVETTGTQVKVGSFTSNTGAGHQQVTGLGFQPKALIFYSARNNTSGFVSDARSALGFSTGSSFSYAVATQSATGVTPSDSARRMVAAAFAFVNTDLVDGGTAQILSLDSDGFTLSYPGGTGTAYVINYIAIGGAGVENAKVVTWATPTATGNKAVTGVGFQPGLVLHASDFENNTTLPHVETSARFSMGAMDSAGNQWTNGFYSLDAVNPSDTQRFQRTNLALASIGAALSWGHEAAFASMDSDGFTTNFTSTDTTFAMPVMSLCIKGPQFKVGSFNGPIATGTQAKTGVGFTPKGLVFSAFSDPTNATPQGHAAWSLGATSGVASSKAAAVRDLDAVNTTSAQGHQGDLALSIIHPGAVSTNLKEAALSSFDPDGWTLNFTTSDASAREVLYLAIGEQSDDAFAGWGIPL